MFPKNLKLMKGEWFPEGAAEINWNKMRERTKEKDYVDFQ